MSGGHQFWRGKRVLITGHSGFKGTWLLLWLRKLGAEVVGYSNDLPSAPSMYRLCGLEHDGTWVRGDIRDEGKLLQSVLAVKPDIVFHLAAQPLVRRSYMAPIETIAVNVVGTANVLNAIRSAPSVRAAVIVTSDKCYANTKQEQAQGHALQETDRLGGLDPYSASKASAELIVEAYRHSYFQPQLGGSGSGAWPPAIATVRAGNVIGGGDFAIDRIVPDCVRAAQDGRAALLRNPHAVRPWQHVLEPLAGYMMLAEKLFGTDGGAALAEAWNFGPAASQEMTVSELAHRVSGWIGAPAPIVMGDAAGPYEAAMLRIDSSKAHSRLGWQPVWSTHEAVDKTGEWYQQWRQGASMRAVTDRHIQAYEQALAAQQPVQGVDSKDEQGT
ncbi:CDP-glucose 4,6-dehydratase [Paenibacillus sp. MMS18-CY102]|uniref:CDP-glucose 4,6-dehydratase n=1 Tax=Paenibacillus sp. MMS18-CY102 TaxID=2682849 RepID=UPI0013663FB6|nr:CDP-glucose 4,6-dehydratase [Paenibacillus sp. MMS18-CY102]